jgi:hypothetical protein
MGLFDKIVQLIVLIIILILGFVTISAVVSSLNIGYGFLLIVLFVVLVGVIFLKKVFDL